MKMLSFADLASATAVHPCFDAEARHRHGRIHLPVAPRCNVQCGFCNRRYDCLNESRPGVTSGVLSPGQALWYLDRARALDPSLSVVGIAGPGDPMANPMETLATLTAVRDRHPSMVLCLATNGLALAPHVDELARLQVSHVTVTVNAVDPAMGARIYRWVRDGSEVLRGRDGAARLLVRQIAGIRALKAAGIMVKINTILIPGVNDGAIGDIADAMRDLGADLLNIMPMHPVEGTLLAPCGEPGEDALAEARNLARTRLPLMEHCSRCRADAVGRIGEKDSISVADLIAAAREMPDELPDSRPHVAVASREGVFVNMALGQAEHLLIYAEEDDCFRLLEVRPAPEAGQAGDRWEQMGALLHDCKALVASEAGPAPRAVLGRHGVRVLATEGMIEDALELVFSGREDRLRAAACAPKAGSCGGSCGGGGGLCA